MNASLGAAAALLLLMLSVYVIFRRTRQGGAGKRRKRGRVGTAAVGAVYELLNEDKRRAIEIIVEEKAEERRPEYPDGDLPQLEDPKKSRR